MRSYEKTVDAERFYCKQLPERLAKFNLALAPEKTRIPKPRITERAPKRRYAIV